MRLIVFYWNWQSVCSVDLPVTLYVSTSLDYLQVDNLASVPMLDISFKFTTNRTFKHISLCFLSLRKHAYSNVMKILPLNNENFQIKKSGSFHTSAQKIDCGYSLEPPRWGGSNEYPQSMSLSRNKKNNVYSGKPQFYYIKVGFQWSKLYRYVFMM